MTHIQGDVRVTGEDRGWREGWGEGVLAGPSLTCLDEVLESLTHVQGDVRVTGEDRRKREQVSWRGPSLT